MVMDIYYNSTQQHQYSPEMLWRKINSLHLSYLEMEESPEKIEHKNKLENCIHSYLCVAHHNQKFECAATPQVLHDSAARMCTFSGYKAAFGWDAIGRYAANLLTKPWRREYRQIKMYSGFYKHEVESNLAGADAMFVEMGYHHVDNQLLVLTGPICPDRLTSVSLDSIMAYVECQILKEIWEEVSQVFNVTWLDVLSLRETHAGSPQETTEAMIYMKRFPQPVLAPAPKIMQPCYASQQAVLPPPQQYYPASMQHSCCSNFYLHNPPYPSYNYNVPRTYYPTQQPTPMPIHNNQQNSVPTGQLIEFDSYDTPDGRATDHVHKKLAQMYINDTKPKSTSERDDGSGTYESWDYVYRNLESQGYSKDLGERGDLLQNASSQSTLKQAEDSSKRDRRESKYSTYDNVSERPPPHPQQSKAAAAAATPSVESHLQRPNNSQLNNGHASTSTLQTSKKGWHCTACTFLNNNDKDICDMCFKSRKKPTEEHLQVGGTQCEKCTFVNNKGQKICSVCSSSLNNSPTYI